MKSLLILKRIVLKSGFILPERIDILFNIFRSGKLLKNFPQKKIFKTREELYHYVNDQLLNNRIIDYLKFGVYKGQSMSDWISINRHDSSTFVGFDSFTGLPEDWSKLSGILAKGYFSTNGQTPDKLKDDKRIRFVKGYFQETLGPFIENFNFENQLVINMDADLYASTLFVLTKLEKQIKPGTIIIFDEFTSGDEFRAFTDFVNSYLRQYNIVAVAGITFQKVAIEIIK